MAETIYTYKISSAEAEETTRREEAAKVQINEASKIIYQNIYCE